MGTSITTQVQVLKDNLWIDFSDNVFTHYDEYSCYPFSEQNYGLFGFLADVRNSACIPVLDEPRGLPAVEEPDFGDDITAVFYRFDWDPWPKHVDSHSETWFLVSELLSYNYDIEFENRRGESTHPNFENTTPEGTGVFITIRKYIGQKFFEDLEILKKLGDPTMMRVVISFRN